MTEMGCSSGALASTGMPVLALLALGLLLLGLGALLLSAAAARSKRSARAWPALVVVIASLIVIAVHPPAASAACPANGSGAVASGGGSAATSSMPGAPVPPGPDACLDAAAPPTITANPAAGPLGSSITVTVTVSGEQPGSIQVLDAGVAIGSAAVAAGSASVVLSSLAIGIHQLTARFNSATSPACSVPPSAAVVVVITGESRPGGGSGDGSPSDPDLQWIQASIRPGVLSISTPYTPTHPADLGALSLTADGSQYQGSCPFGDGTPAGSITITDTRAGNENWTATVQAADLVSPGGARISGTNVGLVDLRTVPVRGNALDATNVGVADHPAPPVATGADGPSAPAAFAWSSAGGTGTIAIIGRLTLSAPAATPPGNYAGTVTFTVS